MKRLLFTLALAITAIAVIGQTYIVVVNPYAEDGMQKVNTDAGGEYYLTISRDTTYVRHDTVAEMTPGHGLWLDQLEILDGYITAGGYQGDPIQSQYIADLSSIYSTAFSTEAELYALLSDVTQFLEAGDNAALLDGTPYRFFVTNGSGDVTEIALGTLGQVMTSNGGSALPSFQDGGGTADSSFVALTLVPTSSVMASEGRIYYDSDSDLFLGRTNTEWDTLNGGGGSGSMPSTIEVDSLIVRSSDSTLMAIHNGDTLGWYWPIAARATLPDYALNDVFEDSIAELRSQMNDLIAAVTAIGVDVVPPRFSSAEIGTYNDTVVVVLMDTSDIHQDSIPPSSAFALTEDGNTYGIDAVTINEDTVFVTLDSIGAVGATYLLSYTKGYPALQDSSFNEIPSWSNYSVTNNVTASAPSVLNNTDSCYAWYQAGDFTTQGDTVVSSWNDATNDRDIAASSGSSPSYSGDTVVFEYTDDNLTTGALYNLSQPYYIYAVIKVNSFTSGGVITASALGGNQLAQIGTSPQIAAFGSSWVLNNTDLTVGSWHIMRYFIDGSSSSLQIDGETATTADMGSTDPHGIRLGSTTATADMEILEVIVMHTDYDESSIYQYLQSILPE